MSEAIKAAKEMREAAAFAAEMFGTENRAASMKPWSREDDIALIVERDYALANHIRALPLPEANPDPRDEALAKAREALEMIQSEDDDGFTSDGHERCVEAARRALAALAAAKGAG